MELILKQTISTLGQEGDIVTVKSGYGRNYLLPQRKAVLATPANKALLEQNKAEIEARREAERKIAEELSKKISGLEIVIEQLAGDDGRLFGSVTSADIAAKLAENNIDIDRKQILLVDPIKTLGTTAIAVKVGFQMTTDITVNVVPTTKG
ncbi:50S ribosomal protein L9 [Desulfoprunum benzoelyticum]|uniref:Large ribosomal subunit protein bL9 n=1 Tax=Desulfoprunum benzoelyticum TaxID=1506996 RepID=A0A840UZL5_9BACT|nr:50S ribosomal protein L9 [Desulfoprunum benzoelyticum]MBB5346421.1 large subunit ribosomal protein L9 [Desulfoprunum benzoelyticum]MBM9528580.1 50S ribosomal protein L9 [Desulfoprunum benzoelyticum]